MDSVSAGASVVTFITLTFSVTKTFHNVLSLTKKGPRVIQYISNEFTQISSILVQLSQVLDY